MENWLGTSLNQIKGWTTVREYYSRALEQAPLLMTAAGRKEGLARQRLKVLKWPNFHGSQQNIRRGGKDGRIGWGGEGLVMERDQGSPRTSVLVFSDVKVKCTN